MNILSSLMIGWGVFWFLALVVLVVLVMQKPRTSADENNAAICALLAGVAVIWIIAWSVVRSLAA